MTVERIIELLNIEHQCILRNTNGNCDRNCGVCDLVQKDADLDEMYTDAIAILKAHEPRVMTLAEAAEKNVVWYDWRTLGVRPAKVNRVPSKTGTYRVQRFGDIDDWVHADEYGEYWRCWTSCPTDEQREATPWNN